MWLKIVCKDSHRRPEWLATPPYVSTVRIAPGDFALLRTKTKLYEGRGSTFMADLKYPQWQKPYEEALLERDPQKLQEKLMKAETAIFL